MGAAESTAPKVTPALPVEAPAGPKSPPAIVVPAPQPCYGEEEYEEYEEEEEEEEDGGDLTGMSSVKSFSAGLGLDLGGMTIHAASVHNGECVTLVRTQTNFSITAADVNIDIPDFLSAPFPQHGMSLLERVAWVFQQTTAQVIFLLTRLELPFFCTRPFLSDFDVVAERGGGAVSGSRGQCDAGAGSAAPSFGCKSSNCAG